MKRTIKTLAVMMVAVMLCLAFVSCGKTLSGEYKATVAGSGAKMVFDGSNVRISVTLLGEELAAFDATYEIKDDKITFDIANEEEITNDIVKDVVAELEKPAAFEEGEGYIKIADTKYEKVEK